MAKKHTRTRKARAIALPNKSSRRTTWLILSALVIVGLLVWVAAAQAQSPQQDYDLSWWTVDGGGYTFSTGGSYSLGGTAGQPDAGLLSGGGYELGGGFWGGGALEQALYQVYLPLILR